MRQSLRRREPGRIERGIADVHGMSAFGVKADIGRSTLCRNSREQIHARDETSQKKYSQNDPGQAPQQSFLVYA